VSIIHPLKAVYELSVAASRRHQSPFLELFSIVKMYNFLKRIYFNLGTFGGSHGVGAGTGIVNNGGYGATAIDAARPLGGFSGTGSYSAPEINWSNVCNMPEYRHNVLCRKNEKPHSKSDCNLPMNKGWLYSDAGGRCKGPGGLDKDLKNNGVRDIGREPPRYMYSKTSSQCEKLNFLGCGGNSNNFYTMDECSETCKAGEDEIGGDGAPGINWSNVCNMPEYRHNVLCRKNEKPHSKSDCNLPMNKGWSYSDAGGRCEGPGGLDKDLKNNGLRDIGREPPRYMYSKTSSQCEKINFLGCGGNSNNFYTMDECSEACEAGEDGKEGDVAFLKKIWNLIRNYFANKMKERKRQP
jgi:hypothetical protein